MPDPSTAAHQPSVATTAAHDAQGRDAQSSTNATGPSELAGQPLTTPPPAIKAHLDRLYGALRHFPDFPIPGIDFVDILPIFADPTLQESLLAALEYQVLSTFPTKPDVIVALDARGFLFGPGLALRLGCRFAPVRKQGKLPGPVETASYLKEYGEDFFQMQTDAVKEGQTALIVDDIIATGGSAQAAGALVKKLGGKTLGYLFILELDFLKGRDKLDAPVTTLLAQSDKE